MKLMLSLLATFAFIAIGCNKDKLTTIPQLDLNSISPGTVNSGDIIQLKGEFRDKEGDIDSALVIYKWFNGGVGFLPIDTQRYSMNALNLPEKVQEAEITVAFQYNTFNPNGHVTLPGVSIRDTTAAIGLLLIDKKGNRSEYRESDQIRLIKP